VRSREWAPVDSMAHLSSIIRLVAE
jgi:hypothetical protein